MTDPPDELVERRIRTVLAAAREAGASVPLSDLRDLLPTPTPRSRPDLTRRLEATLDAGELVGDRIVTRRAAPVSEWEDRRARGLRFLAEAERVMAGPLAPMRPLLACVAVTGSTAYGEPAAGDDLDFFLVTRNGAVWPVLLWAFLSARRRKPVDADAPAHWCFNSVLDEREARAEFARSRGFLFAREALTARPVWGEQYYRGLVGASDWMRVEIPLVYETWAVEGLPPPVRPPPAPVLVRALNLLLWPWMAAYITSKGLLRNHRFRKERRTGRAFRVVAKRRRMELRTDRFEALRRLYATADVGGGAG